MTLNRRQFLGYLGAGAALSTLPVLRARAANPHVVVVGGGFGGATCAKYLRRYDSTIDITLIEPSAQYITCPGSNWMLGWSHRTPAACSSPSATRVWRVGRPSWSQPWRA